MITVEAARHASRDNRIERSADFFNGSVRVVEIHACKTVDLQVDETGCDVEIASSFRLRVRIEWWYRNRRRRSHSP